MLIVLDNIETKRLTHIPVNQLPYYDEFNRSKSHRWRTILHIMPE